MLSTIRHLPLDTATRHHAHDFHQIVITVCGEAEFEIEGLGGHVNAFSGCIVPANHEHYYSGNPHNRQLILDLPEQAPALSGEHRELVALFDAPRFFSLDTALRHYLAFLDSEIVPSSQRIDDFQHDRLAVTLLGALKVRLGETPTMPLKRLNLAQIHRYIQHHLSEDLRVADLARLACLSEAHFSARFRAQTGLSPWQYVRSERLSAARQLLLQSRLPLTDIALQTGFANQSALSHAFRRRYGIAPRHFREHAHPTPLPDPTSSLSTSHLVNSPLTSSLASPLKLN